MTESSQNSGHENNLIILEAERRTDRDNILCLIVLAAILLGCELLNEIGVFEVAHIVMRIGAAFAAMLYLVPVVVLVRPLRLFAQKDGKFVFRKWYKDFIVIFAWLGTAVTGVMLTHHAVIVMAVPIMIMSQYRNTRKIVVISVALGTVCVLLGVYGGFFLGCFDANLLHAEINNEVAADLSYRISLYSPYRMWQLLTHYVLPRELVLLALIFLATKISSRSNAMIARQSELKELADKEARKNSAIQIEIINGMANLIENRDESTGEHVKRTGYYVKSIVLELMADSCYAKRISPAEAKTIIRAAPLHDIGKIVVPDSILLKPGRLTPTEYEEIKKHASEGARVIKNVLGYVEDEKFLLTAQQIAGSHHERWDGNGYPEGLAGENIPLSARIMAVADVFDALVSERVYKSPMSPEEAFEEIAYGSGSQFDPEVVRVFIKLKPQIMSYIGSPSPATV